jgi:hypothetical protein
MMGLNLMLCGDSCRQTDEKELWSRPARYTRLAKLVEKQSIAP